MPESVADDHPRINIIREQSWKIYCKKLLFLCAVPFALSIYGFTIDSRSQPEFKQNFDKNYPYFLTGLLVLTFFLDYGIKINESTQAFENDAKWANKFLQEVDITINEIKNRGGYLHFHTNRITKQTAIQQSILKKRSESADLIAKYPKNPYPTYVYGILSLYINDIKSAEESLYFLKQQTRTIVGITSDEYNNLIRLLDKAINQSMLQDKARLKKLQQSAKIPQD